MSRKFLEAFGGAALVFALFLLIAVRGEAGVCEDRVETREGPVRGAAAAGEDACVYKGIPYAAAPVGELRWRPPEPPAPRRGVFMATTFGRQCFQPKGNLLAGLMVDEKNMSEDCLSLNLWRPARAGTYPVMVWIHGGDLLQGAGSLEMYAGDRLAASREVVVVTINYRLGPFGYLYHSELAAEDPHHSAGNYGLLDQVAALGWVRDNIAGFGGDPSNVTIFGESAGGWSVCHLLASPLARGLFQRAVIESGGCECARSVAQGADYGEEFAGRLGCGGPGAAACMRGKSGPEIIAAMGKDWQAMLAKFFPHVDGYALEQTPLAALQDGRYNRVPLLVGSTRDEFKLFSNEIPGGRLLPDWLLIPVANRYLHTELDAAGLRLLYPVSSYRRPADALLDALGDAYLGCPCYRAAEAAAAHQPPVFYYRFDYDDHLLPHLIGAAHATELPLVFGGLDRSPANLLLTRGQTKKALPLAAIIMSYWTNFARAGDPNGPGLPPWPAYTSAKKPRLLLDLPVTAEPAALQEKCAYWEKQKIVVH